MTAQLLCVVKAAAPGHDAAEEKVMPQGHQTWTQVNAEVAQLNCRLDAIWGPATGGVSGDSGQIAPPLAVLEPGA